MLWGLAWCLLIAGGTTGCLRASEQRGAGGAAMDAASDQPAPLEVGGPEVSVGQDIPVPPLDLDTLDAPRDAPPRDATVDTKPPLPDEGIKPKDIALDKPIVSEGIVTSPCSANASVAFTYDGSMHVCTSALGGLDQCNASKLCNVAGGWHVCMGSEFRARGGTTKATMLVGWVSACIGGGPNLQAPSNTSCSGCINFSVAQTDVAWSCANASVLDQSTSGNLGVATASTCRRLGLNDSGNGAYWQALPAATQLSAAVCCKNPTP